MSNKSNKRLMRYCTFIFSISCSIASVTSYFIEKEAKNLQNGDVHIAQIPDFEMNILRTIWRIEVGDGSLFCIFDALSFELNFFRPEVPFKWTLPNLKKEVIILSKV